jgi:hypothetical protein
MNFPELLEVNRGALLAVAPENVDHLPIRPQACSRSEIGGPGGDELADGRVERGPIRSAIAHERRQRLVRVEEREPPCTDGGADVDSEVGQLPGEQVAMRRRGDRDPRVGAFEPVGEELGDVER